ncbi:MAG: serine/threonine-protein kinase [Gemmatimonadaceae bacterium]
MPAFREELQAALVGRYAIERELSSGSMSLVYRAMDVRHGRAVAIKALRPEHLGAIEGDRFLREIAVVARLQHPHILPLFDSGEAAGGLYYVMPFVDGATLRERLQRDGRLGPVEAVAITREVCGALSYAHGHDVLHRDIKPENILLSAGHALVGDFGIARALHAATTGATTASGIAVGTPAYMSPEQASGEHELTERSDVYSLACVLYEMLTGVAPHAGSSIRSMLAARLTEPPRDLRMVAPELAPALSAAVMRALALDPKDRFPSAAAFSEALGAAQAPATRDRTRRTAMVSAVIGLLAVVAGGVAWSMRSAPEPLDAQLFAVLPFAGGDESNAASMDGVGAARLVTDALSRWRGVRLADDMRVRDAVARRGGESLTLSQALALARSLGAGRLVWGSVGHVTTGTEVRISVFAASGRPSEPLATSRRVFSNAVPLLDSVSAMTDELLTRVVGGGAERVVAGTRDADALAAYLAAQAQLSSFNLDSAVTLFARAGRLDTTFARAQYWFAQSLSWSGKDTRTWEAPAARAVARGPALTDREQRLASALLALARGQYPDACVAYDALIARDSLDFEAWFGKGDCLMHDRLVVRDERSPSRWRFRASAHAAVNAYARAMTLAPSFGGAIGGAAINRLERLLLATPNDLSTGYASGETMEFAAYPGLEADTLSLVPWPAVDVFANKPGTRPRSYVAALDRNRELLRALASNWVAANPQSALAHEHLALALENQAKLDTIGQAESALGAILAARALPHTSGDSVRFMATQLRLLVKLSLSLPAKALADTMTRFADRVTGVPAKMVASAAMLTGRLRLATQLLRSAARDETIWTPGGSASFPISVADPGLELAVYASAGAPGDMVRPLVDRTSHAIDALARDELAPFLRAALLDIPVALGYPATGLTSVHLQRRMESRYLGLQVALERNDQRAVRAVLDSLAAESAADRPGDAGMEYVLIEARARLKLGDRAGAQQVVDAALGRLPNTGRVLTSEVTSVGSLIQLWSLQAVLDPEAAHTPGDARPRDIVTTLWRDADPVVASALSAALGAAQLAPTDCHFNFREGRDDRRRSAWAGIDWRSVVADGLGLSGHCACRWSSNARRWRRSTTRSG